MKVLCSALAALLLAAVSFFASPAYPTSFSTDQSDLYYIAAESGWGIQLVQRGSTIFATMFVYGPTGSPTWYVATMNSTDGVTWTGDLFATTGTYFATVPFNQPIGVTKVGTMTWLSQTTTTGMLTYDVNGVPVVKNVTRQTLVFDNYSGMYLGAVHFNSTGCTNPADNGSGEIPSITITVTQSGQSISMAFSFGGETITLSGTLSQNGQFGAMTGTYTDTFGDSGTVIASALNVQVNSLAGSFTQDSSVDHCHTVGYFAGMRSRP